MSTSRHEHHDLAEHLERWVAAGLIRRAEAEAIAWFEQTPEARPRRVPLVTEAIGYVGAALLLAAGASLVSEFWDETDEFARIAVLSIGVVLLLWLGWSFRASSEPAVGRLAGVLWLAAVGAAAGLAAVVAADVVEAGDRASGLSAGLAATAVAMPLYVLRPKALQHTALFLAATLTVATAFGAEDSAVPGLAVWAFAAAWVGAGAARLLPPERAAYALGSAAMLISAMLVADFTDAGLWLGLATAGALLAASVIRHERVLLGFGAVGLFAFLVRAIQEYLGGGAGMAAGLAAAGLVILGAALVISRTSKGRLPRS